MELVSPSATTTSTAPQNVDSDAPGKPARRLSVARTALLGLIGSSAGKPGAGRTFH